ncbi:peptidase domain-containing ABC transporter [Spirochaeta dissipatitropha]
MASIVLTILGITGAMYFRFLVDDILFSESRLTLHVISLGVVLITLMQVLLNAVRQHMLLSFSMKVDAAITLGFLRHLLHLPLSFFDSRKVGEILSRLGDTMKIREALSSATFSVFFDTLMVLVIGTVLAVQNLRLFLIALAFVPLSGIIVWGFARPFRRKYTEILSSQAESQALLVETVSGMATVKGNAAEESGFTKIEKRIMQAYWPQYRTGIMQNVQGIMVGLIDGWGGNILFWIGSVLILNGQVSLGQLISFNALLGYFLGPLQNLINLQPSLQEAFVAARRVGEILDLETEQREQELLKPERIIGPISFSHVDFRYGSKKLVLEDISFNVEARESVGIVGPSGSGKSSLIKLLMKFYDPEQGSIHIGGQDLRDIDSTWLRQKIGYVSQDVFLFHGTVRDNIALGKPEASYEEIVAAAQKAQAHEFISNLPNRYDTELAEQGSSLSGGERQRLAIARPCWETRILLCSMKPPVIWIPTVRQCCRRQSGSFAMRE